MNNYERWLPLLSRRISADHRGERPTERERERKGEIKSPMRSSKQLRSIRKENLFLFTNTIVMISFVLYTDGEGTNRLDRNGGRENP